MLAVSSAKLVAPSVLRVTFSKMPLMTASGNFTARNKFAYTLTGAQTLTVVSVKPTKADPYSVDIQLSGIPSIGTWTVETTGVQTVDGDALNGTISTTFESDGSLGAANPGASAETAEDRVRKFLNPGLVGEEWEAYCAAVGYSDRVIEDIAAAGLQQNFFLRAQGIYLERLTAGIGVERPAKTGMKDATLGRLASDVNANKLTDVAILNVLKAYYGEDAVRSAIDTTIVEPFVLADGQYQLFNIDGVDIRIDFETDDFTNITAARAHEVAAVINRKLIAFNLPGLAVATKLGGTTDTILRIYSGRLGQSGFVSARGGSAQVGLGFPTSPATTVVPASLWNLTTGSTPSTARLTFVAGTDPTFSAVEVDDIVNLFGSTWLAGNHGSFVITAVSTTWIEFAKPATFTQQLLSNLNTYADLVFWRPTVGRLQGYFPNVVSDGLGGSKIVLPATSTAISRTIDTGWYLHGNLFSSIESATRDANGQVTVETSEPHGLQVGDVINLQNWVPDATPTWFSFNTNTPWPNSGGSAKRWSAAHQLRDGSIFALAGNTGATSVECWRIVVHDGINHDFTFQSRATPPTQTIINRHGKRFAELDNGQLMTLSDTDSSYYALYNPDTNAWVESSSVVLTGVTYPSLARLSDGRIVALGPDGSAAVYSAITGTWTAVSGAVCSPALIGQKLHEVYVDSNDRVYIVSPDAANNSNLVVCDVFEGFSEAIPINWIGSGDEGEARPDSPLIFVPIGPRGTLFYATNDGGTGLARFVAFDLASETTRESASYQAPDGGGSGEFYTIFPDTFGMIQIPDGRYFAYGGESFSGFGPDSYPHFMDLIRGPVVSGATTAQMAANFELTPFNTPGVYNIDNGSIYPMLFTLPSNYIFALGGEDGFNTAWGYMVAYVIDPEVTSGLVPNDVRVTSVLSATSFTFDTPTKQVSTWSAGEYAPTTSLDTFKSGFMLDTKGGVTIVNTRTTLTAPISKGPSTNLISVASAANFPDEPGYIVFNFGFKNQVGPIEYLGSNGTNTLRLAPGQNIPEAQASGATVTLLRDRGIFSPDPSKGYGVTWLTASAAGRIECENDVEFIAASGSRYDFEVLYPGDRGLGHAGLPDNGAQRLSDRVAVWGGDTLDAELAAAREDDV